jgi:hypothetical protein
MRKWIGLACLSCLVAGLSAQEIEVKTRDYSQEESVFAPYVSGIRVGTRGDTIVISWTDSPDLAGTCAVYRSSEPITAASFDAAVKAGTVAYGTERFEDKPGAPGDYYYAILIQNAADSSPYRVFVPFRNTTAVAMTPDIPEAPKIVQPTVPSTVNSISATVESDAVVIKLSVPRLGHRLILYRGAEPIKDSSGILSASIVTMFEDSKTELKDYPVPGIDYYYAILDEVNLKSSDVRLVSGQNTTSTPVKIKAGTYRIGLPDVSPLSRTLPLPYLVVNTAIGSGERIGTPISMSSEIAISSETEKAIDKILAGISLEAAPVPEPSILPPEAEDPVSGEEYTLITIVRETVQTKKWSDAILQLEKFLSLYRLPDTVVRSRFYLGQAYAMTGLYRNALFSMLIAQDDYYSQSKPWIEFCLQALREKD